ncbi:tetratricopeptide repeat protein [Undibacterium sp. CY18W]|uniref:Tetratricopeptide repeat protein n=1 Tax=Undibacterium hunanense TaxID=2762292 RepID=A0ABR6ZQV9_9BURK|nr:tetratricopeptide repeat protein [Undibacterium hunanense]MBC3918213.1 tetratricopeptide repeat protein [Undibacterium hunanense]
MLNKTLPFFIALLLFFNEVSGAETSTIDQLVFQSSVASGSKQYDKARELAERALTLAEHDPDFPRLKLAQILTQLGFAYQQLNQFDAAQKYSRRVVDIVMILPSADARFRAFSLTHLAEILTLSGDPAQAETLATQALALVERELSSNTQEFVGPLGELGAAFLAQDKTEQASKVLELAIRISEFAPNTVGTYYQNLFVYSARLYRKTGQQEKAVEMENKANSIVTTIPIPIVSNVRPAVAKPVDAINEPKH